MTLKMALLAPMPSARVKMAIAVKAGAFTNIRSAYFRSLNIEFFLFRSQRDHRIDRHRATRRKVGGDQSRAAEHDGDNGLDRQITGAYAVKQTGH